MDNDTVTVRHRPETSRYELVESGTVIGSASYVPFPSSDHRGAAEDQRIFFRTVVDDSHAGQGLAGRLAAYALDDTVSAGLGIVPVCPYIKAYLGKHEGYAGAVAPVEQRHLDAVPSAQGP